MPQSGPMSYYRLGTNYPRQRLRESYPDRDYAGRVRSLYEMLAAPPAPPVTVYATLPKGIATRAEESPLIAPLLAGGVWYGVADDDTPDPFVSFHFIDEQDNRTTGRNYWRITVYQVEFYADSNHTLELLWEAWNDEFNFRRLVEDPIIFERGVCFRIDSQRVADDDDHGMAQSGKGLRRMVCEVNCYQNRRYPA